MAAKLRLNKNALREQSGQLRLYLEFLPTLELRKRQLQAALTRIRRRRREGQKALEARRREAAPWSGLLQGRWPQVRPYAAVEEVVTRSGSVAGVAVPVLDRVRFVPREHCLLATPPLFDDAVALAREVARRRAELAVLAEQARRVAHQLRRTTQRINLYDKVLVPQARRNIRRLKVYLGDQQTAAVCRAKIAKAKLVARAGEAEGGHDGHR